jgi:hypothetical protein
VLPAPRAFDIHPISGATARTRTTALTVTDAGLGRTDTYRGEASYLADAPRDQRQATEKR